MYIRLGKSNLINNPNNTNNEFFIVSQVVDSQLGYEKPIIVKTKEQLDIWFGNDYSDYNYMSSLVEQGVCLYISKPLVNSNPNYVEESTTFYSDEVSESINTFQRGFTIKNLPEIGEENFIYKVIDPQGINIFRTNDGELINYTRKTYSKEFNTYTIPEDSSISDNNRDTLVIFSKDCPIKYCTPSYKPNTINPLNYYIYRDGYWIFSPNSNGTKFKGKNLEDLKGISGLCSNGNKIKLDNLHLNITEEDIRSIEKESKTLSFSIDFMEYKEGSYLSLFSLFSKKSVLLYNSQEDKTPFDIFESHKLDKFFIETRKVTTIADLKTAIESLGYYIEDNNIYAAQPISVTYFSNLPSLVPDFQKTQDLIYQCFKDKEALKLYSRTLGYGGVEGNIGIQIEDNSYDNSVIITTSRFGYSRTIEAERDTIDHTINNESSLIYCELKDPNFHIPEKEVEMKGAVEETFTKNMYNNSTDLLFNNANVYPDYFLIPDLWRYTNNPDDKFYETILSYSKYINCQVLIQNTWENYTKNYLKDLDNRLIYFLGDITLGINKYPGYYLYLSGLLNDVYSISANNIIYKSPTDIFNENIYDVGFKKDFDKYKSNYLIYNDKYYYYNTFLNGETYNTTGWMRFAISKISREIEKNKWQLIGERDNAGKVEDRFNNLFQNLVSSFRIIDSIRILKFNLDQARNRLDLTIQTNVNDLVKNDITLELTVNYTNKYNNI